MILIQATIKYKGYDPDKLKLKSHKRVCCSCDNPNCKNPIRYVRLGAYTDLCHICSQQGENNGMFGKHHSNESIQKMRDSNLHLSGENSSTWQGGKVTLICEICCEEYQVNKAQRGVGIDIAPIKPNDTITWFNHYRDIGNQVVAQQEIKSNQYQKGVIKNDLARFVEKIKI